MQKSLFFLLCITSVFEVRLRAQSQTQAIQDAFLISRMAEKYHVQPRPLDAAMSSALFFQVLDALDEQRIFFTREDIAKLSVYRFRLDQEIRNRHSDFLPLLTGIFKQRLIEADTMIDHIAAKPFVFTTREQYTAAEDTSYPDDLAGMHVKLFKMLKYSILNSLLDDFDSADRPPTRKQIDSLEPRIRKKAVTTAKRAIKRILQSPMGIENMTGIIFCQELAGCYDPHTTYFNPDMKADFESELGNAPVAFGFTLRRDDDGGAEIGHLAPGSPAFQSGALNEGDKIQSVQWDDKEAIDVTGASVREVSQILSTTGGDKATLMVKKADGTSHQVTLHKEKIEITDEEQEEDKVTGFLLKGAHTIGYISLPAFYSDWEDSKGINGCANDVAKEIIKLKKENIEGLILDLRYNGGGSMEEAIELSGIFIDNGPVAQIKDRDKKVVTLKDVNRGTIYDGPLLLLVNGYSASASEMVAGTLQDYHRALIVGSPTYGKATAQVVLPMDTTIDLENYTGQAKAASYIKITVSRLYRVSGASAQFTGVIPDVILPDPFGSTQQRESDNKSALPPTTIEPNKYYRPLPPLPLAAIAEKAKKEIDSSAFFSLLLREQESKKMSTPVDHSLLLDEAWKQKHAEDGAALPEAGGGADPIKNTLYTVANHAFEQKRLNADHTLLEANQDRRNDLLEDPYIQMAYRILLLMPK